MNHNDSNALAAASRRQVILILTALFVVAFGAGAYFLLRPTAPSQVSHGFLGTIERVEGNTIIAQGTFLVNGVQVKKSQEAAGDEVRITLAPSTALTRISWQLPEGNPNSSSSLAWNTSDLKQSKSPGSLEDLVGLENVPFSSYSEENILYKNQFEVQTLEYLTTSFYKPQDKIPK